jgi:hypothetical protein
VDSLDDFEGTQREHSLRRENDRLKATLKQRDDALAEALGRLAVLEGIDELHPDPPKWLRPRKPSPRDAFVVAMLSDCHWDEVVRAEDVAGVNAYDRAIATDRTRAWADSLALLPETGPEANVKGLVLLLGGDLTCGLIDSLHLVDSEDTTLATLLYWSEQAAASIRLLADAYERVHVPVVVGNHGRMTAKKRTHLAARDNTDFHLAHLIRRLLADDRRVTWQIDEAPDAEFPVFDQRHVLTHGDSARGGSGIGGVFPPIMRMVARKQQRQAALGRPFDHLWLGHFHQVIYGPSWSCNGSMKGYDGYASSNNFPAEPPAQIASIVTAEGISWRTAIRV